MPTLFGHSRSSAQFDHTLIAPDSHVPAALQGWQATQGVMLASPRFHANFLEFFAHMAPGAHADAAPAGVARFIYVQSGSVRIGLPAGQSALAAGAYAYLPAGMTHEIDTSVGATLVVIEKRYQPHAAQTPAFFSGRVEDVPFAALGTDGGLHVQVLLPAGMEIDMQVNVMNFEPGAALGLVECHVMEHGLLMLDGQGIYRLGNHWYPVQAGDFIYMAPYCPQWFGALGQTPSRYLIYKDWNRNEPHA